MGPDFNFWCYLWWSNWHAVFLSLASSAISVILNLFLNHLLLGLDITLVVSVGIVGRLFFGPYNVHLSAILHLLTYIDLVKCIDQPLCFWHWWYTWFSFFSSMLARWLRFLRLFALCNCTTGSINCFTKLKSLRDLWNNIFIHVVLCEYLFQSTFHF